MNPCNPTQWFGLIPALGLMIWLSGGCLRAALGQSLLDHPNRMVAQYDFESVNDQGQKIGQAKGPAPHWYPIGRAPLDSDSQFRSQPLHQDLRHQRGYPSSSAVRMDDRQARSGQYALFMEVDGGHVGAFTEVGAITAVPGSDYQISAYALTRRLHRAGARLRAYFIDSHGRRIKPSVKQTRPTRTDGKWHGLSVMLDGDYPRATWIGIEMEVRQPVANPDDLLDQQQVVLKDIEAAAWFDDITVRQVPRATLTTQSPVNIIRSPNQPRLTLDVRDLSGRQLVARTTVYDEDRKVVARDTRRLGRGSVGRWRWTPPLPSLGWYRVEMRLIRNAPDTDPSPQVPAKQTRDAQTTNADGPARLVARARSSLLWLGSRSGISGERHAAFGLHAPADHPGELSLLPTLLDQTGLGAVALSAWTENTNQVELEDGSREIDRTLEQLAGGRRILTASICPLPQALADQGQIERFNVLALTNLEEQVLDKWLRPLVMRHGERVRRWLLGRPGQANALGPALPGERIPKLVKQFQALTPRPTLVLPWRLDQSRPAEIPSGVEFAIAMPSGIGPSEIGQYLESWQNDQSHPAHYELILPSDSSKRISPAHRVRDLVKRMIYAWQAGRSADGKPLSTSSSASGIQQTLTSNQAKPPSGGLTRLSLSRPWTLRDRSSTRILPDPRLGAFINTARRLAGRRVVSELDLGQGLEARVLDGQAGGMLVVWNERGPADTRIHLNLGAPADQVHGIDVWGNRRPIAWSNGRHHLRVPRTPMFIEGIDPDLARFRAGFELDKPLIESTQKPQQRTVSLTNAWERTISGQITFTGPEPWTIHPKRRQFSIPAGQTRRIPLSMRLPISEPAGAKRLTAQASFYADQSYDVAMEAPMKVGLPGVNFKARLRLTPPQARSQGGLSNGSGRAKPGNGNLADVLVRCVLTNTGESVESLSIFANLHGYPRQERSASRLEPGQSVVRRFRFSKASQALAQYPVRTGVRQSNGPAVLNYLLRANDLK